MGKTVKRLHIARLHTELAVEKAWASVVVSFKSARKPRLLGNAAAILVTAAAVAAIFALAGHNEAHRTLAPLTPTPAVSTTTPTHSPTRTAFPKPLPVIQHRGHVTYVRASSRVNSLWDIAAKYLGHGDGWTRLARINHLSAPYTLHVGELVRL